MRLLKETNINRQKTKNEAKDKRGNQKSVVFLKPTVLIPFRVLNLPHRSLKVWTNVNPLHRKALVLET